MKQGLRALVTLLGPMVGTASAQDARSAVQAAATAIGATNLRTIQIPGRLDGGRRPELQPDGRLAAVRVNTHHHFDHSGGLRTYVSQGAIVATTPANLEYYRTTTFYPIPRTLQPDRLATFSPMFSHAGRFRWSPSTSAT